MHAMGSMQQQLPAAWAGQWVMPPLVHVLVSFPPLYNVSSYWLSQNLNSATAGPDFPSIERSLFCRWGAPISETTYKRKQYLYMSERVRSSDRFLDAVGMH